MSPACKIEQKNYSSGIISLFVVILGIVAFWGLVLGVILFSPFLYEPFVSVQSGFLKLAAQKLKPYLPNPESYEIIPMTEYGEEAVLEKVVERIVEKETVVEGQKPVVAAASEVHSVAPTNMLANSSFEADILGGQPEQWGYLGSASIANTTVNSETFRTGNLCLKLEETAPTTPLTLGLSQPRVSTVKQHNYVLSLYIKGSGIVGSPTLRLGFIGGNVQDIDEYADYSLIPSTINDWKRYYIVYKNPPTGKYPFFEIRNFKGGKIFIDDTSLNEVYTAIPPDNPGVLPAVFEHSNTQVGDGSVNSDFNSNLYPSIAAQGQIGMVAYPFVELHLTNASISNSGKISTNGDLEVKGNTSLKGDSTRVYGNLSVDGTLGIGGMATFNNITITGLITGNLIPATTDTYSLGDSSHYWRDLYLSNNTIFFNDTTDAQLKYTPGTGATGELVFDPDGDGTANVVFEDGGNVGVGTVGPNAALEVLKTTEQLRLTYDASNYVSFTVASDGDLTVKPTTTGQVIFQPTTDSATFFQVLDANGGTPVLNVDADNERVGIGTTAPEDLLEIQGAEETDAILTLDADDGDDTTDTWEIRAEATGNDLSVRNNDVEVFNLTTTGDLQIDGDFTVSGGDITGANSLGFDIGEASSSAIRVIGHLIPNAHNTYDLGADSHYWRNLYLVGNTIYFDDSTDARFGYSRTNNEFTFDPDGDTANEVVIEDDGQVGIGTTEPASLLEVLDYTTHPILTITGGHDTAYDPQIKFRTDAIPSVKFSLGVDASNDYFKIFSGDGVGDTSELVIDTAGNLGLNTSTPTALLDVAGDASISGSLVFRGANKSIDVLNGYYLSLNTSVGGDAGLAEVGRLTNAGSFYIDGVFSFGDSTPDGNAYNTIGTGDATHTSAGEITDGSDLYITDDLEVDGTVWVDGNLIAPATGVVGYWRRASGALSPANITDDLLMGNAATASAYFWVQATDGQTRIGPSANALTISTDGYLSDADDYVTVNDDLYVISGDILGANSLGFDIGEASSSAIQVTGHLIPSAHNTYDLGADSHYWRNLYLVGNTVYFDDATDAQLGYTASSDQFSFNIGGSTAELTLNASTLDVNLGTIDLSTQTVDFTLNNAVDSLNFDSNTLSIDALNNQVGIGTAAPTALLDAAGDASISGSLVFRGNTATIDILNGKRLDFQTSDGGDTGLAAVMTILNSGYVGIGTTAPGEKLDVSGNATVSGNLTFYGGARTIAGTTMNSLTIGNASTGNLIMTPGGNLQINTTGGTIDIDDGIIDLSTQTVDFTLNNAVDALNFDSNTLSINALNNRVGVGTAAPSFRLDIQDSQASTVAAQIFNTATDNTADGLLVKLGIQGNPANTNHFIEFQNGYGEIVGSIRGNGALGVQYKTEGLDFAEYFEKEEGEVLEEGDLVCLKGADENSSTSEVKSADTSEVSLPLGTNRSKVTKCTPQFSTILGVVSAHPGFVGGGAEAEKNPEKYVLVGLIGQVPLKISDINGVVRPGDPLTFSEIPGVAAKALSEGTIVGRALEATDLFGTIKAYVNPSWYNPGLTITAGGELVPGGPTNSLVALSPVELLPTLKESEELGNLGSLGNLGEVNGEVLGQTTSLFEESIVGELGARVEILKEEVEALKQKIENLNGDQENVSLPEDLAKKIEFLEGQVRFLTQELSPLMSGASATGAADVVLAINSTALDEPSVSLAQDAGDHTESPLQDLTILGRTNLGETFIGGHLQVGLLSFDDIEGAINILSLPLKLQDNPLSGNIEIFEDAKILLTKEGDIYFKGDLHIEEGVLFGNESFSGQIEVARGQTEVKIEGKDWSKPPSVVNLTPSYKTMFWVTDLTEKGFVIHLEETPSEPQKVYWLVIFHGEERKTPETSEAGEI